MAFHELLAFRQFAAFVNCEVDSRGFTCGIAYLAPGLPPVLPLSTLDGQVVCAVEITADYRNYPTPQTITAIDDDLRFTTCPL